MRKARLVRANSVSFALKGDLKVQVSAFFDRIKEGALRPAAHAMALVLYDEMRSRVPVAQGRLQAAIYRWFDKAASGEESKTYLVGVTSVKRRIGG